MHIMHIMHLTLQTPRILNLVCSICPGFPQIPLKEIPDLLSKCSNSHFYLGLHIYQHLSFAINI